MFTDKVLQDLSIDDIRIILDGHRSNEDSAKAFIRKRFVQIQANDDVIPIVVSNAALVMHLVPLADFEAKRQNKIPELKDLNRSFSTMMESLFRL